MFKQVFIFAAAAVACGNPASAAQYTETYHEPFFFYQHSAIPNAFDPRKGTLTKVNYSYQVLEFLPMYIEPDVRVDTQVAFAGIVEFAVGPFFCCTPLTTIYSKSPEWTPWIDFVIEPNSLTGPIIMKSFSGEFDVAPEYLHLFVGPPTDDGIPLALHSLAMSIPVAKDADGTWKGWSFSDNGTGLDYSVTFIYSPTPEPGTWAMMIGGFGLVGAAMRRKRLAVSFA